MQRPSWVRLGVLFGIFAVAWVGADLLGQVSFGENLPLMSNMLCFQYLGCNAGFFGYDALVHLIGGFAELLGFLWLCRRYPEHSILHPERLQNLFILVITVTFLATLWEFAEFAFDAFRLDVLGVNLVALHALAQPSNADTMGDIFFTLLGALGGMSLVKLLNGHLR